MTDPSDKITLELKEMLNILRSKVESAGNIKKDREATLNLYKAEILPNLLQLRRLNRDSKDRLEEKHEKVKELSQRLVSSHQACQNLLFEASCLDHEVASAKERLSPRKVPVGAQSGAELNIESGQGNDMSFFDVEKVGRLDHETRTRLLEEEERRRKKLRDELEALTKETENIEVICEQSAQQLDQVKPYIKQLIDKVAPIQPSSS